MARPLCIYHKNCLDGSASAAVVKRKEPDCEFLSMQYSQPPPQVLDRRVYIVDFGLPLERMRAIKAQASEVIWIDHHASHLPIRAALGWGTLDTSECGASLTWKCLFPTEPPPPVLAYIKDKDLWTWQLPDSRAVAAGMLTRFKGDHFDGILEVDLAEMARIGRPELDALAARVSMSVKAGVAIQDAYALPGVRALAINCNQDQNDVGDHICLPLSAGGLGYDLAILFYRKGGGRWVHSLRSGGAVDCAAIAEARGGGGHRNSACYLADEPFMAPPAPPASAIAKNDPARR